MSVTSIFLLIAIIIQKVSCCSLKTYPYVVTLRTTALLQTCGGTLLHSHWVLTAAHCLYTKKNFTNLRIVEKHDSGKWYQLVKLKSVFIYELYDPKTIENDFALIYLEEAIIHSSYAALAGRQLISHFIDSQIEDIEILAWKDNVAGSNIKYTMQEFCIISKLYANQTCLSLFGPVVNLDLMLCVSSGSDGKQPCKGDSGSPVFIRGYMTGILSFGIDCEKQNYLPSVYSRVDGALEFIKETVEKKGFLFYSKVENNFTVYYVSSGDLSISKSGLVFTVILLCKFKYIYY